MGLHGVKTVRVSSSRQGLRLGLARHVKKLGLRRLGLGPVALGLRIGLGVTNRGRSGYPEGCATGNQMTLPNWAPLLIGHFPSLTTSADTWDCDRLHLFVSALERSLDRERQCSDCLYVYLILSTISRSRGSSSAAKELDFSTGLFEALCDPNVANILKELLENELRQEVAELRRIVQSKDKQISNLRKCVNGFEEKMDVLEQYSQQKSLRISGIPEKDGEDVLEVTLSLVNSSLLPPLTIEEVGHVHRVSPKLPNKKCPILVKLATYRSRRCVFATRKNYKLGQSATGTLLTPSSHSVYVNEDLTKLRAHVFYECRKAKKSGKERPLLDCRRECPDSG